SPRERASAHPLAQPGARYLHWTRWPGDRARPAMTGRTPHAESAPGPAGSKVDSTRSTASPGFDPRIELGASANLRRTTMGFFSKILDKLGIGSAQASEAP